MAQPPREDPGDPPTSGWIGEGWGVLTIPNLPQGAVLGDVWASPDGKVYVWAKYPGGPNLIGEDPGDGEKLPNPPGGLRLWSSTLYRYDGTLWTVALRAPGEVGVALLGSGTDHVYATTKSPVGDAYVHSFDGTAWSREYVPSEHPGQLHTLAGAPGNLYLKMDYEVMHSTGAGFSLAYHLPVDEPAVRGLVSTDPLHLFVMCSGGQHVFNNGAWTPCDEAFAFTDVEDAWGMRDASGVLHMYAVGSQNQHNGIYVWRFTETDPIWHLGTWSTVASSPPGTGGPGSGYGQHIWGAAENDIYAAGVVQGKGRILRYNGFAWAQLYPPVEFGAVHGVFGNGDGVVWFSTEDGLIIRYRRPEPPLIAPMVDPALRAPLEAEVNHGAITVRYALTATTPVQLGVYDVMGRQLGTIEDGIRAPGTHVASWNLGSLDSGIYFVKLRAKGTAFTRRVVVIR